MHDVVAVTDTLVSLANGARFENYELGEATLVLDGEDPRYGYASDLQKLLPPDVTVHRCPNRRCAYQTLKLGHLERHMANKQSCIRCTAGCGVRFRVETQRDNCAECAPNACKGHVDFAASLVALHAHELAARTVPCAPTPLRSKDLI
eukprot:1766209-Prymnesium_polylepis.1